MQYVDMEPFEQYVRSHGLVEEKRISFYTNWIFRFLRSDFQVSDLDNQDLLQAFSDQLGRDDSLADWQRRQAIMAVELYLNVYLPSRNVSKRGEKGRQEARGAATEHRASEERSAGENKLDRPQSGEPELSFAETLARMKELLKLRHYSPRTEKTYVDWTRRFFRYANQHKLDWRAADSVRSWLSEMATVRNVAASTQNQAFSAALFLFRETLKIDLPAISAVRAKRGRKLPVVFSPDETARVLGEISGVTGLMLRLTYGAGLRISETLRLRVKDLDFDHATLFVRSGKGDKDRATVLPEKLVAELRAQLERVRVLHEADLKRGFGAVWLPGALARKYPNAPREWKWQYVFPAAHLSVDPESGATRRHHVSEQPLQRGIKKATAAAGVEKNATVHTLRHSFATHLLLNGVNIREVQELLGHKNVETTMIYTHVVRGLENRPQSPLDLL